MNSLINGTSLFGTKTLHILITHLLYSHVWFLLCENLGCLLQTFLGKKKSEFFNLSYLAIFVEFYLWHNGRGCKIGAPDIYFAIYFSSNI